MGAYSVADAKNNLSELIDRALEGEAVVVTRHGRPVVEIKAIQPAPRPITKADLEWLRAHRVRTRRPRESAGKLVERMRDEDWD
jgi:antitoxin (DNA-binding transcriptional repressor) of toxin-antitoxin stability system